MENWTKNAQEQEDNHQPCPEDETAKLRKVTEKIGTWALILGKIVEATLTILTLFKSVKKP
jgi:hypothetical protein